jgi:hypothetical protein
MNNSWSVNLDCDEVVSLLTRSLEKKGFSVHRSFDLQSARDSLSDPESCPCPNHGTAECTCQYIVLQVSVSPEEPVSLVVHGHDDRTMLSLDHYFQGEASKSTADILQDVVLSVLSRTTQR